MKVNYDGLLLDPIPGDIRAGAYGDLIFDGTYHVLLNAQQQGRYPPGTLYGLTLTNDAGDTTNDIGIAVGSARDGADSANMDWLSAYVKQLDVAWAVGTAAGGLDTGAVGNNTYYIWGIKRPDTGVTDYLFSLSSTAPTMPTNYTIKRLFGQVIRTGGVNGKPTLVVPPFGVISGTYTPTLTNTTNLGASTAYVCQYMQIGNIVWVSGKVDIDPTSSGAQIALGMSLPVPSAFTAPEQLGGTCNSAGLNPESTYLIVADATNDRAMFAGNASTTINAAFAFSFMYRVV